MTELAHLATAALLLGLSLGRLIAWLSEPGTRVGEAYRPRRPPQMLQFWLAVEEVDDG